MSKKNKINPTQLDDYKYRLLHLCAEYQKHILFEISRIKANCMIEHSDNFCKSCEAVILNDIGLIQTCFGEIMRIDALYGEKCDFMDDKYEEDYVCSLENECKRETSKSLH